jgi:hypothetical protein
MTKKLMKNGIAILGIFCLFLSINYQGYGQPPALEKRHSLNFYLDCDDCDFSFVQQELDFISFVRDPQQADVHIFMTESRTGSGGRKYFLNFIGLRLLKGSDYEYQYTTGQLDTDDEVRRGLLQRIKTGILQYFSKIGNFDNLEILLKAENQKNVVNQLKDPWKKWVFRIEAGSDFEKEASRSEYSLNPEIRIEKVTDAWKTKFEAEYDTDQEQYIDDGNKIISKQKKTKLSANYIKSLTPRWSVGFFGSQRSDTYTNIKSAVWLYSGLQYNIFPWDVSNQKVFTLRYDVGVHTYRYNEITIYDKIHEIRSYQAIKLELELNQPWGRIESSLESWNYLYDFSKNKLSFDTELSVRLAKQFSVYGEFEAQAVHNQLYLPKGDASLEDILLKRHKQATTYELSMEIGFRFTFGSIYNNVINERL